MKQLFKKSLVLLVLFATLVVYSNEETQAKEEKTNNVTKVTLQNVQEGSTLLIKDKNGVILHEELIEQSGTYSKGFDFTNLPDAEYYIELDSPEVIEILPFMVSSNIAEFVKTGEQLITKPMVNVNNDYVSISKNTMEKQSIEIEVYYEGFDLAFSEKLRDVQNVTRIYDFSNSLAGNYTIVLSSEGRTFVNEIEIP